ncbi:MAG: hypothetical protein M1820_007559 [Bogoriella megaspora]|nr:MAG: hypothetical protein M1820_007559 [Bogoriella megaspora]
MSADLFAAFGQPDDAPRHPKHGGPINDTQITLQPKSNTLTSALQKTHLSDSSIWDESGNSGLPNHWGTQLQASSPEKPHNEDDWGDYEVADASKPSQESAMFSSNTELYVEQNPDLFADQFAWGSTRPVTSVHSLQVSQSAEPGKTAPGSTSNIQANNTSLTSGEYSATEVLFDAEDEIDDFGDFEGAGPSIERVEIEASNGLQGELLSISKKLETNWQRPAEKQLQFTGGTTAKVEPGIVTSRPPRHVHEDLISISDEPEMHEHPAKKATPPQPVIAGAKPQRNRLQKKSAWQPVPNIIANDDDNGNDIAWDDFPDHVVSDSIAAPSSPHHEVEDIATDFVASMEIPLSRPPPVASRDLPATNIPPPVIVLSLFPVLFKEAQSKVFQPLAAKDQGTKIEISSHDKMAAYLHGCLALVTTTAHVIAGRKLRWKRDSILSQSMRIGPAGKQGGMKLTGIDKAENSKEEREVVDVLRAWNQYAGRLRSAISAAQNARNSMTIGAVPELQETMVVKTAKQTEGGVPAPRPCALCGLRRDERVLKVDNQVQDSFGEWWVDQEFLGRAKGSNKATMKRGLRRFACAAE